MDIEYEIRRIGVSLEKITDNVAIIAEVVSSNSKKIDKHSDILNQHSEKLDILLDHAQTTNHRLNRLEQGRIEFKLK